MTTQTECEVCHRASEDTIMTRDGHVLCRPCAAQAASALGCAPQDLDLDSGLRPCPCCGALTTTSDGEAS